MSGIVFDTHAFVKRLTGVGMPEEQAEALADEQARLIDERLATKGDLNALEVALKADLRELDARLTANILKWMLGALAAQATIIVALIKLL